MRFQYVCDKDTKSRAYYQIYLPFVLLGALPESYT